MSDIKKVYSGLTEVDSESTYHLGFYSVDFPDGELTFQLHARICAEAGCLCDNIAIDWNTEGRITHTWFTAEHDWLDHNHQPVADEMRNVFDIVKALETFQERYSHLVFLRRRQVLQDLKRLEGEFQVRLPRDLVGEDGDAGNQTLGKVHPGSKGGKAYAYALEFCGDSDCYCNNMFLALLDGKNATSFCIDPKNKWSSMANTPESNHLMQRVEPRLMKRELFGRQLSFFRTERLLQNYHRYVTRYLQEHRIGV